MESGTDIAEIYLDNVFDGAWPFVIRTFGLASFVKFFFSCLNLMFETGRLSKVPQYQFYVKKNASC